VADANHLEAEYAVLVADNWQGRGLGNVLTDYCLEICRTWGIDRVVAETTTDNQKMQIILAKRGFKRKDFESHEVLFEKRLGPDRCVAVPAGAERHAPMSAKSAS
jgi:acetyltransferase